ncbi:MAG: cytidine deaminase [Bacteroidota bacterium]|nr:cytidine deaminase [Bacteroidota bacterium]
MVYQFKYTKLHKVIFTEIEKTLFEKALEARANAYAKYSNFGVGCAILLDDENVICANNQENAAFPSGLCAERAALFWAKANYPSQKILSVMIVGGPLDDSKNVITSPCGACRQSLLQYEIEQETDITIYFGSTNGNLICVPNVKNLLPFCFDGSEL